MSRSTEGDSDLNLKTFTLPSDHPLNRSPWKNGGGNEFMLDFITEDENYLIVVERLEGGEHFKAGPYCHVGLYKNTGDGHHEFEKPSFKEVISNEDLQSALREVAEYANEHLIPGGEP